ncbi:MAG TPA: VWA domain-containing protein [Vineibacter sp.]|nr:VWA domain-containing protein [Vineibacter sp.]
MASDLPNLGATQLARRQLHVILALDCSGSMTGDKIASLNYAMRSAIPEMRSAADDNPETDVFLRVLRFSTRAEWHVYNPTPVGQFEWQDVSAGGETNMGEALGMMADVLNPERMPGRQLPPVLVMVSDGQPSDDFETGLAQLFESPYGGRALRIAIAIGSDADNEVLERFIAHPDFKPLRANNAQDLVNRIKWATTAPVKSVSSPSNAPDAVTQLALDAQRQRRSSDLLW